MRKIVLVIGLVLTIVNVKLAQAGWEKNALPSASSNFSSITIGEGRNDDTTRLFAGSDNGKIIEYTFKNGIWEQAEIANVLYPITAITIGNGRNDGNEVDPIVKTENGVINVTG